jgi:hypothetical protein
VLITKNFVASGDPGVTTVRRVRGASLRAYDKLTARSSAKSACRRRSMGMPMTYSVTACQYIVVGVSGGNYTGEYIAFRCRPASCRARTRARSVRYERQLDCRKDGLERVRPFVFCSTLFQCLR